MTNAFKVVVLISGRGSNLGALVKAAQGGAFTIVGVISNRPAAKGLTFAREAGIPTQVVDHTEFADRPGFDAALARSVKQWHPDLVVLAGFMRILTAGFVESFYPRLINLHPSVLPAYPGLHTHERAIAAGDEMHGSSVHYVDTTLDGGPLLMQTLIKILPDDTPDTLAARLLPREHQLLASAVELIARGQVEVTNRIVTYDGKPLSRPLRLTRDNEIVC